jgi:hypothetical protein
MVDKLKTIVTEKIQNPKKRLMESCCNQISRGHQKETDYKSMDRSLYFGRIICQYMTHFFEDIKKDSYFLNRLNLNTFFAIPQVQKNGDYFIGFCYHTENTYDGKKYKISTPTYGILFRAKENMYDSLYIGPCNSSGLPHTDPCTKIQGLSFFDLDFDDKPFTSNYKSFYRGHFVNGLFEG